MVPIVKKPLPGITVVGDRAKYNWKLAKDGDFNSKI